MSHSDATHADSPIALSIIIVSWNVWDLLRACLVSIERVSSLSGVSDGQGRLFGPVEERRQLEVIVVDNASSDGTPDNVTAHFPWVKLIACEENLGFTRGNNVGFAASRGDCVYFLNPDTELDHAQTRRLSAAHTDSLWTLYSVMRDDDTLGMVGPQLRYADNSPQPGYRRFPTPITGFFESTWLGRAWPANPWARRLHMADWAVPFRRDVDWLVGAAMLCRRAALVNLPSGPGAIKHQGGQPFDEGFFMYSEELDLCRRIKAAGWRIVFVPEAVVIHYEGKSSEQVVAARHIRFNTSKVRYWRKWFGPRWAEALRRYLLLEFHVQVALERAKWLLGHRRDLRRQRIAAYHEVIASGLRSLV